MALKKNVLQFSPRSVFFFSVTPRLLTKTSSKIAIEKCVDDINYTPGMILALPNDERLRVFALLLNNHTFGKRHFN